MEEFDEGRRSRGRREGGEGKGEKGEGERGSEGGGGMTGDQKVPGEQNKWMSSANVIHYTL
jgi:hypothetical protein